MTEESTKVWIELCQMRNEMKKSGYYFGTSPEEFSPMELKKIKRKHWNLINTLVAMM